MREPALSQVEQAVAETVPEILRLSLERCMKPPLTIAAIAANGAVFVVQYVQSKDGTFRCELLAENHPGEMQTPVNFLIVDAVGSGHHASFEWD
jgi:hypothetical protein